MTDLDIFLDHTIPSGRSYKWAHTYKNPQEIQRKIRQAMGFEEIGPEK